MGADCLFGRAVVGSCWVCDCAFRRGPFQSDYTFWTSSKCFERPSDGDCCHASSGPCSLPCTPWALGRRAMVCRSRLAVDFVRRGESGKYRRRCRACCVAICFGFANIGDRPNLGRVVARSWAIGWWRWRNLCDVPLVPNYTPRHFSGRQWIIDRHDGGRRTRPFTP